MEAMSERRLGDPGSVPDRDDQRDKEIADLRKLGWSLQRIGIAYGISKQRVKQILDRHKAA